MNKSSLAVELYVFWERRLFSFDAFGFVFLETPPGELLDDLGSDMPRAPQDRWGRSYQEIGEGWYLFLFRRTT